MTKEQTEQAADEFATKTCGKNSILYNILRLSFIQGAQCEQKSLLNDSEVKTKWNAAGVLDTSKNAYS